METSRSDVSMNAAPRERANIRPTPIALERSFRIPEGVSVHRAPEDFDLAAQILEALRRQAKKELADDPSGFLPADLWLEGPMSDLSDDPEESKMLAVNEKTQASSLGLDGPLSDLSDLSDESHDEGGPQPASDIAREVAGVLQKSSEVHNKLSMADKAKKYFKLSDAEWTSTSFHKREQMKNKVKGKLRKKKDEEVEKQRRRNGEPCKKDGPALKKLKEAEQVESTVCIEDLGRSEKGWIGTESMPEVADRYARSREHPSLEETMQIEGMRLIRWDGIEPKVIRDSQGNAVTILAGSRNSCQYRQSCVDAHAQLSKGFQHLYKDAGHNFHRRGNFQNPGGGFGMGGGSTRPSEVKAGHPQLCKQWKEAFDSAAVQEIVRFSSSICEAICPQYLQDNDRVLNEICERDGSLSRLKSSAFAATTFNVGRRIWTLPHKDFLNLACWFCSVTALGNFDPTKGGHLVLWELKMVVEFLPGSTIFIPSALITHSNVSVASGQRTSIVQYSAAGLFHYAHCGFQTLTELKTNDPEKHAEYFATMEDRVENGLRFFESVGKAFVVKK